MRICLILYALIFPAAFPVENPVISVEAHPYSEEIHQFTYWATEQLQLGGDVYLRIKFSGNLPEHLNGLTLYESSREHGREIHQFLIYLDRGMHHTTTLNTLSHEMVHVQQLLQRRLIKGTDKSYTWDSEEVTHPHTIPYERRPWELDAIERGYEFYLKYTATKHPLNKWSLLNPYRSHRKYPM